VILVKVKLKMFMNIMFVEKDVVVVLKEEHMIMERNNVLLAKEQDGLSVLFVRVRVGNILINME